MVQILPPKANIGSEFGQGLGAGVSKGLSQFADYYLKNQRANQLINEIDSPEFQKLSPAAKYATAAKLGMIEPELGRAVPAIADLIKNQAYGGALSDALFGQQPQVEQPQVQGVQPSIDQRLGVQEGNPRQQPPQMNPQQAQPRPMQQQVESTDGFSAYPERSAYGTVQPIRTQEEIYKDAISKWNALPPNARQSMPFDRMLDFEMRTEQSKREMNQAINAEKQTDINFQKALSEDITPKMQKMLAGDKPADPFEQELISKWVNEAAKNSSNLPDIEKEVRKKTENFAVARDRVKNLTDRPNWISKTQQKFTAGDTKDYDLAVIDARSAIEPYLELGEFDAAKRAISEKGFGPVETELIVNEPDPIREDWVKSLQPYKRESITGKRFGPLAGVSLGKLEVDPKIVDRLGFDLKDIFNRDPDVNLILLRKNLEGKDANWMEYSTALKKLEADKAIQLNPTQKKQLANIDKPPMNVLGKIFKFIGLGGE